MLEIIELCWLLRSSRHHNDKDGREKINREERGGKGSTLPTRLQTKASRYQNILLSLDYFISRTKIIDQNLISVDVFRSHRTWADFCCKLKILTYFEMRSYRKFSLNTHKRLRIIIKCYNEFKILGKHLI